MRRISAPELNLVDTRHIYKIWPSAGPLILAALKNGTTDYEEVARKLWRGDALLWVVVDHDRLRAAVVTKIGIANNRKICTIVACGGEDMWGWLPLIKGLEEYAKAEECAAMVIVGREGWKRVLPKYEQRAVVLERML